MVGLTLYRGGKSWQSVGARLLDELTTIRGFFQLVEFSLNHFSNSCTDVLCI